MNATWNAAKTPPDFNKKILPLPDWLWLMGIVLLGAGLRLYRVQIYMFIGGEDGLTYARLAEAMLSGKGYALVGQVNTLFPPLYPLAITLLQVFVRNLELAAVGVSLLSGVLLIVIVFFLGRALYGSDAAIIASAFTALAAPLIVYATTGMSESLLTALVMGALLTGWYLEHAYSHGLAVLTGLLWGGAYLTKPEALLVGLVWLVWFLWDELRRGQDWRIWRHVGVVSIVFAALLFGYAFFMYQTTGQWNLSGKGTYNFVLGELYAKYADLPDGHALASQELNSGLADFDLVNYLQKNWQKTVLRWWHNFNTERELLLELVGYSMFGFLFLNFFGRPFNACTYAKNLYLTIPFAWLLLLPFFFVLPRLFLFVMPVFYLWAGSGLAVLLRWCASIPVLAPRGKGFSTLVLIAVLVVQVYLGMSELQRQPWAYENKVMGQWMAEHVANLATSKILSLHPLVTFYSDGIFVPLASTVSPERVAEVARTEGAFLIVVDKAYADLYNPGLSELIERAPPGWKEIHRVEGKFPVVLYTIAP